MADMGYIKMAMITIIPLCIFSCQINNDWHEKEEEVFRELHIVDSRLQNAIIEYQNKYILSNFEINKLLIVTPLNAFPKKSFEFKPLEHLIDPLESQYNILYVQELPVLIESYYEGLINLVPNKSVIDKIEIYFKNQPALPSTGYVSDIWYVILEDDGYFKINLTDSLQQNIDSQQVLESIDNILYPCLD